MNSIPSAPLYEEQDPNNLPVAIPVPIIKKWSEKNINEKIEEFSKKTEIPFDKFRLHLTHFDFENNYNSISPMEYFQTIEGKFFLNYTYKSTDVDLESNYRLVETYYNRYDPDIEKEIDIAGSYEDDVWISWDEFGCSCVGSDVCLSELPIEHPLWLISQLHKKYNDDWDSLMRLEIE